MNRMPLLAVVLMSPLLCLLSSCGSSGQRSSLVGDNAPLVTSGQRKTAIYQVLASDPTLPPVNGQLAVGESSSGHRGYAQIATLLPTVIAVHLLTPSDRGVYGLATVNVSELSGEDRASVQALFAPVPQPLDRGSNLASRVRELYPSTRADMDLTLVGFVSAPLSLVDTNGRPVARPVPRPRTKIPQ